jgi:amino acid transporter
MISIRRAVIVVAQVLALVFIVLATVAGALAGDNWLTYVPLLGNVIVLLTGTPGIPIFGALIGFFASTMVSAIFYLLVEIAHNTRNPFNK